MLEGLWTLLLAVACLNPRGRPQACLLAMTWLMSYAAVYLVGKDVNGYQAGAVIDAWGFVVSAVILHLFSLQRCWWALLITASYGFSVALQVIFWRFDALGLEWRGVEMYTLLVVLFTMQTGLLAMLGVRYKVKRWRPREVEKEKTRDGRQDL